MSTVPSTNSTEISSEGWSTAIHEQNVKALESMRAIERLGGSEGFAKFLNNRRPAGESKPTIPQFSQNTNITIDITETYFVHLWANAKTEDGHYAKWDTFTVPFIPTKTATGVLYFDSWDKLMSAPNNFTATVGDNVVNLTIGGQVVGQIIIQNIYSPEGAPDSFSISGSFEWHKS